MMIGVGIFGIGSEAMCIIGIAFTATWFMGKELSLGIAVTGAASHMGNKL